METILELLREILKGIVREMSAYFFLKNVLEHKKTTTTPSQAKGWFSKIKEIFDNHRPDGRGCRSNWKKCMAFCQYTQRCKSKCHHL